ncbi:hypothetical protein QBC44DRAFT_396605 [Cladorrhinum sp. PSN332]|nr:hypothetical protein QBC44DRAFT_396605 [Cladorrhinum sp. PSN332]
MLTIFDMIFTTNNRNGGVVSGLKAIALGLFVVPSILGNVGVIATGSSTELPTPSAPIVVTTTALYSMEDVPFTASDCSAISTVTVTVNGTSSSPAISDLTTLTATTTVTSTTTALTGAGVDGDETTSTSCTSSTETFLPLTTVELTSTQSAVSTVSSGITTETATVSVVGPDPTTADNATYATIGTTLFVTGVGATAGTGTGTASWTIIPSGVNGTYSYGVPSASVVFPTQTVITSAANGNGNRGSQVFYCVVMSVAVLGVAAGL